MLLSVVALISSLCAGQTAPRFERLDNGLSIVIVEDHTLPLVSVQLWYRVGSAQDPPDKPGLCAVARAVLEQRDDTALKLRAAGVRFDSRTERDACCFSWIGPQDSLESMLDIAAARMQPFAPTQEMVDSESRAAALRYVSAADDPDHVIMRHALAAMFPDHPYGHPPGFAESPLEGLSCVQVTEFLRSWFVPGNATLLIVGDVTEAPTLEQIRRRFAGLQRREPPPRPEPRSRESETIRINTNDCGPPGVTIAWRTPPLGRFENAAIDVLMQRLGNAVDGPLYRRLTALGCEPPHWQRYAWCDAELLVLSVASRESTSPEKSGPIESLILQQLSNATKDIPSEVSQNRARSLAKREALERTATFEDRAHEWALYQVVGGNARLADFAVTRITGVSVPDVQQAAAALSDARTVILRTSPSADARHPATPARPHEPTSRASAEQNWPTDTLLSRENAETHALNNGVSVVVTRLPGVRGLVDVTTLATMAQPSPQSMQTLLDIGSTRRSAAEMRDYLSYHGLDLSPLQCDSRLGLHSRGPASHIAQMIELQAELLRHPADAQTPTIGELRSVEIMVVGDVDASNALAAARLAWGDWREQPNSEP